MASKSPPSMPPIGLLRLQLSERSVKDRSAALRYPHGNRQKVATDKKCSGIIPRHKKEDPLRAHKNNHLRHVSDDSNRSRGLGCVER